MLRQEPPPALENAARTVILALMRLELIFGIHRATHRIGLFIQRHEPDLTQAEAHILCHLYESGEAAVSDLHRAFAHKRSTLTSVLDRLAARGWIKRELSKTDRRSFVVSLTVSGKKCAAKIHRTLEALEASVLAEIDRSEVEAVRKLLARLEHLAAAE